MLLFLFYSLYLLFDLLFILYLDYLFIILIRWKHRCNIENTETTKINMLLNQKCAKCLLHFGVWFPQQTGNCYQFTNGTLSKRFTTFIETCTLLNFIRNEHANMA